MRSFIAGDKKECGSEPGKERGYLVQVRVFTVTAGVDPSLCPDRAGE